MISDYEKRIMKVFGADEVPEVSKERLLTYRSYLVNNLSKDVVLIGREDFLWEEYYVFGPGSKKEYEKLKETQPSYTDQYKLLDILENHIEENDLIARVKRLSDSKEFEIGLSWLSTKDEKSKDYLLLDDFATWVVNW